MDITNVNLRLSRKDSVVKGIASITIDDCFVIHDLKILEGESGLFIAMPSKKMQDGTYRDVAHPINRETRKYVESVIIDEYNKMLKDEAEVIGSV